MPRYVILLHETPPGSPRPTHWDLMLEDRDILRTWALEQAPQAGQTIRADELPDHRSVYLTYEGPVSGNRGHVTRWDHGDFRWIRQDDDLLQFRLRGQRLEGHVRMTRLDPPTGAWRFVFTDVLGSERI